MFLMTKPFLVCNERLKIQKIVQQIQEYNENQIQRVEILTTKIQTLVVNCSTRKK